MLVAWFVGAVIAVICHADEHDLGARQFRHIVFWPLVVVPWLVHQAVRAIVEAANVLWFGATLDD